MIDQNEETHEFVQRQILIALNDGPSEGITARVLTVKLLPDCPEVNEQDTLARVQYLIRNGYVRDYRAEGSSVVRYIITNAGKNLLRSHGII